MQEQSSEEEDLTPSREEEPRHFQVVTRQLAHKSLQYPPARVFLRVIGSILFASIVQSGLPGSLLFVAILGVGLLMYRRSLMNVARRWMATPSGSLLRKMV
ncbi:MAG: hypothetical protein IMW89_15665 [Ktedonobacteraceae bacterium]|nr:hypothetical protein [Ktedonobacteraceae bacterium]